ncbi:MAG: hypothetical protein Q9191_000129 [Dirinaria sp. TL-2023a]
MGLPIFVEPEPAESKVANKADPSAPARSAIRRQRTVRYTPHGRDRPSSRAQSDTLSRELHQPRRLRDFIRHRNAHDTVEWAMHRGREQMRDRERERERDRGPNQPDSMLMRAQIEGFRAEQERHEASQRQRMRHGRALLRDALSYERPGERMRLVHESGDDTLVPDLIPVSDSARASYSEILRRPQGTSGSNGNFPSVTPFERQLFENRTHAAAARSILTPPYSFEEPSERSPRHAADPPTGSPDYTSGFAPAHRYDHFDVNGLNSSEAQSRIHPASIPSGPASAAMLREIAETRQQVLRTREEIDRAMQTADRAMETADRALDELPHLRRMARRSHYLPSPPANESGTARSRPTVDGLGDRSRSFSPDEDAWDTLFSTMTPDERMPSANSSFTSATASASAVSSLAGNSATNSYGTLVIAPSSNTSTADLYPTICENSDSEDSLASLPEDDSRPEPLSRSIPPRPIYSRRYPTSASDRDRAEQLVSQDAERAPPRFRTLQERDAELQRIRAELERLNQSFEHPLSEETGTERTFARERL